MQKRISRYCALKSINSFVIDVRKSDANGQGNKKNHSVVGTLLLWKLCEVVGMAGFLTGWWLRICSAYGIFIVKHAYNIALIFLV
jgi:hypothetical protein